MAARAIWKGVLGPDSLNVPVKFYSAVENRRISFRLLHAEDGVPVEQKMVSPTDGEVVSPERQQKGFPVDRDRFVIIRPEELESLRPEPSRDIEILRFVDRTQIELPWYDRPYFLGPDGRDRDYAALVEALREKGLVAIARWTMRNKRYHGALMPEDGVLAMVTLKKADEVVLSSTLPRPEGEDPTAKELKMAQQLVRSLTEPFDLEAYRDEHRERLAQLVNQKVEGKTPKLPAPRPSRVESSSLERALKASLDRAGTKKKKTASKRGRKTA